MTIIDSFEQKGELRRPRAGVPTTRFTVGFACLDLNFRPFLTVLTKRRGLGGPVSRVVSPLRTVFLVFSAPFCSLFSGFISKPTVNQEGSLPPPTTRFTVGHVAFTPRDQEYHPFHCLS